MTSLFLSYTLVVFFVGAVFGFGVRDDCERRKAAGLRDEPPSGWPEAATSEAEDHWR